MPAVSSRAIRFHEVGEPLDPLREERVEALDSPAGGIRVPGRRHAPSVREPQGKVVLLPALLDREASV